MEFTDNSAQSLRDEAAATASEMDAPLTSPALARLLVEVRGGDHEVARAYNRTYNRHNR